MPPFLLSALALLRGISLGGGTVRRALPALATGAGLGQIGIPGVDLFPDDARPRRRRRRRALTQGDRNDIAFIAATISSAAAGKFAVQIASRST